jgi:hypothetical protein
VPLPATLTPVPTVVPPEPHELGAEDCGPNTLNKIVPDGDAPPDRTPEIDDADTAVPTVPADGALANKPGLAGPTTVSAIDAPHVEAAALLFESPP